MIRRLGRNTLLVGVLILLAGCTQDPGALSVNSPRARPAEQGMNSAVYMQIINGSTADALIGASSDAARIVQLHRTTIDPDGNASMKQQERIELNPGQTLDFEPGGYHIMLIDLNQALIAGMSIDLALVFENEGEIHVKVPVADN